MGNLSACQLQLSPALRVTRLFFRLSRLFPGVVGLSTDLLETVELQLFGTRSNATALRLTPLCSLMFQRAARYFALSAVTTRRHRASENIPLGTPYPFLHPAQPVKAVTVTFQSTLFRPREQLSRHARWCFNERYFRTFHSDSRSHRAAMNGVTDLR